MEKQRAGKATGRNIWIDQINFILFNIFASLRSLREILFHKIGSIQIIRAFIEENLAFAENNCNLKGLIVILLCHEITYLS